MFLDFISVILLVVLVIHRIRSGSFKGFHLVFGFYIFFVLSLWSLPRIISYEQMSALMRIKFFNNPLLLQFYRTQHVPQSPLIHKYLPVIFFLMMFFVYLIFPVLVSYFKNVFNTDFTKIETKIVSKKFIWFTGLFVILFLLFKELINPYFFTQDDNHAQFFPKILVGLDLIFHGNFPFIDNYQHYGAPLFEIGTYAIFDPLMMISYAIGKYFLMNRYFTLEVYVILSMFTGAILLGYCFRLLKVDSLLSFAATVSFLFAGYFFITIRSWYYVSGLTCYLPALLYFFLLALKERLGWFWFLALGLVRGLFFYAGNAQYFSYALIIEGFVYIVAVLKSKHKVKLLVHYICSVIFTIGVISPLFICQYNLIKEIWRPQESIIAGGGISFDSIITTLIPYPFSWSPHPNGWGNKNTFFMTNMFHIGFVWVIPFILGTIRYVRLNEGRYKLLIVLGTVMFFVAGGSVSLIYSLVHYIPGLNKMFGPFKCFPFPLFFIILYSALVLNDLRKYLILRRLLLYPICFNVLITLFVAAFCTDTAFWTYGEHPYPPPNPGLVGNVNSDDYLFGFAPGRYGGKPYTTALAHNYACVYNLRNLNHYDPLLPTGIGGPWEDLDGYFDRYGITKAVILKVNNSIYWEPLSEKLMNYPVVYEDKDIILYSTGKSGWVLRQIDGLSAGSMLQILEYNRTKIKARIYTPERSKWEYHNEYRKGYFMLINGVRSHIVPSPSNWCMFELPGGEYTVEISYLPTSFWHAIILSIIILLFSVLIFTIFTNPLITRTLTFKRWNFIYKH